MLFLLKKKPNWLRFICLSVWFTSSRVNSRILNLQNKYTKSGYTVNGTTPLHHLEDGSCGSTQHEGEPPVHQPPHRKQRCWQVPVHLCISICTGRRRAGTSLCSCTWRWEPSKPKEEAAPGRWKTLSEEKVSLQRASLGSLWAGSWGTCATLPACSCEQALACWSSLLWIYNVKKSEGGFQKQKLGLTWIKYRR